MMRRPLIPPGARTTGAASISVAVFALALVTVGCGGSASTSASASDDTADVIRATERQRLRALLTHDFDTAQKLHADDFELINPLGEVVSREQYIDSGDAFAYSVWKPITPIRVRVHGDAAVIRYESDLEIHGSRGHHWHTDLYEKRDGRWQIVWSQTTGAP
jgi:ketosteroid isomerase-like protein